MCLCGTFRCCISPLQAGSNGRTEVTEQCSGEGTGGVDVHSSICAQGNVSFAPVFWVILAAEDFCEH